MKIKKNPLLILLCLLGVTFSSCNKETTDKNENPVNNNDPNGSGEENWGAWTNLGTSNIGWFESPIVVYNNKFWHIAGEKWDENANTYIFTNSVFSSDDGLVWNEVNANPDFSARALNRTVAYNQNLYVVGGVRDGGGEGSDVWASNDGVTWSMEADGQFAARERFGLLEFDNSLWIFGGGYYDFNLEQYGFTADIYKSDDGKSWEEVSILSENHPIHRIDFFTFVYDNKMWIISGNGSADNSSVSSDVWSSADGELWELIDSEGPVGEIGDLVAMNALGFDDKIWVLYNGKAYYSVDGKEWVKNIDEANEWGRLIDAVVFNNSIYVFTEQGDVWQLKKNSTK